MTISSTIAGTVILYNPERSVIDNICSYIDHVGKVYVVDNSDHCDTGIVQDLGRLRNLDYICCKGNTGIAHALNMGAQRAIADGFEYLLTMDQDSIAMPGMVDSIMQCYAQHKDMPIGLVSPVHLTDIDTPPDVSMPCRTELTVWTSGNILNLRAFEAAGPFRDELFIDFVDHEYCLRLNEMGFKVMRSYAAVLKHKIGSNIRRRRLLGVPLIVSNHSAIRRYYITRNRLLVAKMYKKRYPEFYYDDKKKFIAEIVTIVLFEEEKIRKLLMIAKGCLHYYRGIQGSLRAPVRRRREGENR